MLLTYHPQQAESLLMMIQPGKNSQSKRLGHYFPIAIVGVILAFYAIGPVLGFGAGAAFLNFYVTFEGKF